MWWKRGLTTICPVLGDKDVTQKAEMQEKNDNPALGYWVDQKANRWGTEAQPPYSKTRLKGQGVSNVSQTHYWFF
jgi:hypothetical protein